MVVEGAFKATLAVCTVATACFRATLRKIYCFRCETSCLTGAFNREKSSDARKMLPFRAKYLRIRV